MAELTVIERDAAPAFVAADAAGDQFVNDGATEFQVKNSGAGSVTVTAVADGQCRDGFLHDLVVVVGTGLAFLGPFEHARFGRTDGRVRISYSATANIEVMPKRQR